MVSQSDLLPMMTATSGALESDMAWRTNDAAGVEVSQGLSGIIAGHGRASPRDARRASRRARRRASGRAALRALAALGHRLTFAGQPRLGELLEGLEVVPTSVSFDGFGFEALFVDDPPPAPLRSRLARFRRAVSWFGAREACYRRRLAALVPACIVAPPVPDPL